MLGGRAGADRDMQVEQLVEAPPPALPHGNGRVQCGDPALGDAHHADPSRVDLRIGTQQRERREGVALHLRAGDQGLISHRAAHAAAGEAVDDQGRDARLVEGLCIIMLAMALHAGAAGQQHHAGKRRCRLHRQMQRARYARRLGGGRMIERQRVERYRFHGRFLACPLGSAP